MNKSTALLTIAFVALSSFASAEPSSKKKAPAKAVQKTEESAPPVVIVTSSGYHIPTFGELLLAGLEDSKKKVSSDAKSDDKKPEETKTDVSVSNQSGAPRMELVTTATGTEKKIGYDTTATDMTKTNKAKKPRRLAMR